MTIRTTNESQRSFKDARMDSAVVWDDDGMATLDEETERYLAAEYDHIERVDSSGDEAGVTVEHAGGEEAEGSEPEPEPSGTDADVDVEAEKEDQKTVGEEEREASRTVEEIERREAAESADDSGVETEAEDRT